MSGAVLALIRHGEYHQASDTPSAQQPWPLTSAGESQSRALAGELQELMDAYQWTPADQIITSTLLRAHQTGQIVSQHWPIPANLKAFEDLSERNLGSANNLSITQIQSVLEADPRVSAWSSDWKSNSTFRLPLPGAESLMDAGRRVAGRLKSLNRMFAANTLVPVIGHGAAFRHAAYQLGVLEFDEIQRLSMFHAKPVCLQCAPSGVWTVVAGAWKVRASEIDLMDSPCD
jgi:Fructose-2,6-bisphosphatase